MGPLFDLQPPQSFPFLPLAFEDAMRILSNSTYTALPTDIYRWVGGQEVNAQEAAKFREQFLFRRTAERDKVIAQLDRIIRKKTAFARDFPLTLDTMKY